MEQKNTTPTQDQEKDDLLTVKELAAKVRVHPRTVFEWIYKKGLPVKRSGEHGQIRVSWSKFDSWFSKDKTKE
jgi:excisionase family DNA binding protein